MKIRTNMNPFVYSELAKQIDQELAECNRLIDEAIEELQKIADSFTK